MLCDGGLCLNKENQIFSVSELKAGKTRFSGERNSVLLKANSGAPCAPHNFVLLVTLWGTSVCLTECLAMHQRK